jgi:murein DD-endopeptidase MepM/ murein hydrolase activator NlpD
MAHHYGRCCFRYGGYVSTQYSAGHRALDISPRNDDDGYVFAVEGGTVVDYLIGKVPGSDQPNFVVVRAIDGNLTIYAHVNCCPDIYYVVPGWPIERGWCLGKVDLSGESSGRHVHLVRLPAGTGTVDDVLDRVETEGRVFTISTSAWPAGELPW